MSVNVVPVPLPSPRERYDRENEAQLRSTLERTLEELITAIRELDARVEALESA